MSGRGRGERQRGRGHGNTGQRGGGREGVSPKTVGEGRGEASGQRLPVGDDRDRALKEEMRMDRLARANRSPVYTGIIVEMRDNFGFVQPFCSAGLITAT